MRWEENPGVWVPGKQITGYHGGGPNSAKYCKGKICSAVPTKLEWETLRLNLNYPRNPVSRNYGPDFTDDEELSETGWFSRSQCLCLTLDSNPRSSNFVVQTLCPKLTFMCLLTTTPLPQLLGKLGGEEERALGIFVFILCYLSQINSVEKMKWAQYHIVFELLTTILILTRKKYHLIEIKPLTPILPFYY